MNEITILYDPSKKKTHYKYTQILSNSAFWPKKQKRPLNVAFSNACET
jgi:hypothetical protein